MTLPEYDQNPVVFAANLEEVVTEDNPDTVDNHIQGNPNQNCPFLRVITQKLSISDPKLVKPKCV